MKNGKVEESDIEIVGKIAYRIGNENQEPCFVYISGISKNFSSENKANYLCEKLNTGTTYFSHIEDLRFEIDYKKFKSQSYKWEFKNRIKSAKRYYELMKEYQGETK